MARTQGKRPAGKSQTSITAFFRAGSHEAPDTKSILSRHKRLLKRERAGALAERFLRLLDLDRHSVISLEETDVRGQRVYHDRLCQLNTALSECVGFLRERSSSASQSSSRLKTEMNSTSLFRVPQFEKKWSETTRKLVKLLQILLQPEVNRVRHFQPVLCECFSHLGLLLTQHPMEAKLRDEMNEVIKLNVDLEVWTPGTLCALLHGMAASSERLLTLDTARVALDFLVDRCSADNGDLDRDPDDLRDTEATVLLAVRALCTCVPLLQLSSLAVDIGDHECQNAPFLRSVARDAHAAVTALRALVRTNE
ncbi:MAG: hypothetical protein MHM6MM_003205 [Cercozoa sp. M6MM]